uniref:Uncharacterized protein n=1 Tax=Arundo donax TaxID=35708 RepID=A0A0A9DJN4_ARUDO
MDELVRVGLAILEHYGSRGQGGGHFRGKI